MITSDPTLDESVDDLFRASAPRALTKSRRPRKSWPNPTPMKPHRRRTRSRFSWRNGVVFHPKAPRKPARSSQGVDDAGPAIDVFEQRAEALVPIEASLTRKLRRVLADEQNEVLDRLRQGPSCPGSTPSSDHPKSTAGATPRRLGTTWRRPPGQGPSSSDTPGTGAPDLDDVVTALGAAVGEPLRERLTARLSDAGGDLDEATELARAAYREWKTQRLDAAARMRCSQRSAGERSTPHPKDARCGGSWLLTDLHAPTPTTTRSPATSTEAQPFPTGTCMRRPTPGADARS